MENYFFPRRICLLTTWACTIIIWSTLAQLNLIKKIYWLCYNIIWFSFIILSHLVIKKYAGTNPNVAATLSESKNQCISWVYGKKTKQCYINPSVVCVLNTFQTTGTTITIVISLCTVKSHLGSFITVYKIQYNITRGLFYYFVAPKARLVTLEVLNLIYLIHKAPFK